MKYLIVETHPGFCVALSEDGRYVKCANLRYSVGEKVEDVVELRAPDAGAGRRRALKIVTPFAALAACLCVAFFGWYQPNYAAYGALRLSINPDVELTLSRSERVLEAEGLNPDGAALLESVELEGLDAEAAADVLVAGSIEGGWLREGGNLFLALELETPKGYDWLLKEYGLSSPEEIMLDVKLAQSGAEPILVLTNVYNQGSPITRGMTVSMGCFFKTARPVDKLSDKILVPSCRL